MYFCFCTWKRRRDAEVRTGMWGKLVCLVAFLCLFFCWFSLFSLFCFLTFLLSLLHHNKHFLLTFINNPLREEAAPVRCNDEAKPLVCTALCLNGTGFFLFSPGRHGTAFSPSPPPFFPPVNLFLSFNCTYCSNTSSQKHLNLLFSFFLFFFSSPQSADFNLPS